MSNIIILTFFRFVNFFVFLPLEGFLVGEKIKQANNLLFSTIKKKPPVTLIYSGTQNWKKKVWIVEAEELKINKKLFVNLCFMHTEIYMRLRNTENHVAW